MFKLAISEEALRDISETAMYYQEIQVGLETRFRRALEERFRDIQRHPQHYGFLSIHPGNIYRSVLLKKFPYMVIYEIRNHEVIIFGVVHTKRRPRVVLKRLPKR
jgi:plasmid stabilization system protein ParE